MSEAKEVEEVFQCGICKKKFGCPDARDFHLLTWHCSTKVPPEFMLRTKTSGANPDVAGPSSANSDVAGANSDEPLPGPSGADPFLSSVGQSDSSLDDGDDELLLSMCEKEDGEKEDGFGMIIDDNSGDEDPFGLRPRQKSIDGSVWGAQLSALFKEKALATFGFYDAFPESDVRSDDEEGEDPYGGLRQLGGYSPKHTKEMEVINNYTFYAHDYKGGMAFLRMAGFVVFKNVLNKEEVATALEYFTSWVSNPMMKRYGKLNAVCPKGIVKSMGSSVSKARWYTITRPRVSNLFAAAYDLPVNNKEVNDYVTVSLDGIGYVCKDWATEPPDEFGNNILTSRHRDRANTWHTDQVRGHAAFEDWGHQSYQGLVTLHDQDPDKTCYLMMHAKSHHDPHYPERGRDGQNWRVSTEWLRHYTGREVCLKIPAGSLVMWDSRTAHSPVIQSKKNTAISPVQDKAVIYVSMTPKHCSLNDSTAAKNRLKFADQGWNTDHRTHHFTKIVQALPRYFVGSADQPCNFEEAEEYKRYIHPDRGHRFFKDALRLLGAADPTSPYYYAGYGDNKRFAENKKAALLKKATPSADVDFVRHRRDAAAKLEKRFEMMTRKKRIATRQASFVYASRLVRDKKRPGKL